MTVGDFQNTVVLGPGCREQLLRLVWGERGLAGMSLRWFISDLLASRETEIAGLSLVVWF